MTTTAFIVIFIVTLIGMRLLFKWGESMQRSGFKKAIGVILFLLVIFEIIIACILVWRGVNYVRYNGFSLPSFLGGPNTATTQVERVEKKTEVANQQFETRLLTDAEKRHELEINSKQGLIDRLTAENNRLNEAYAAAEDKRSRLAAVVKLVAVNDKGEADPEKFMENYRLLEAQAKQAESRLQAEIAPLNTQIAELKAQILKWEADYKVLQQSISAQQKPASPPPIKEQTTTTTTTTTTEPDDQTSHDDSEGEGGLTWRWQDPDTGKWFTPLHTEVPPGPNLKERIKQWAKQNPHRGLSSMPGADAPSITAAPEGTTTPSTSQYDWIIQLRKQGKYPRQIAAPPKDTGYTVDTSLGVYIPRGGEQDPSTWVIPPANHYKAGVKTLRGTYEQTATQVGWPVR